jgi:toluene monooxygenase system protein D
MTDTVGPVLIAGDVGRALVVALRELNPTALVQDRGAYLRVLVPDRCVLTRAAVERVVGHPVDLRAELERVMPSFKGRLSIDDDHAAWELLRA